MADPIEGNSTTIRDVPGVKGTNSVGGIGVFGEAQADGRGVVGVSSSATGVEGDSDAGAGVFGRSTSGVGVFGLSETNEGIHAETRGQDTAAIIGITEQAGHGVRGLSRLGPGVSGQSTEGPGVSGRSEVGPGGEFVGVLAPGIIASSIGGPLSAVFSQGVEITGGLIVAGTVFANDVAAGGTTLSQLLATVQDLQQQVIFLQNQVNSLSAGH